MASVRLFSTGGGAANRAEHHEARERDEGMRMKPSAYPPVADFTTPQDERWEEPAGGADHAGDGADAVEEPLHGLTWVLARTRARDSSCCPGRAARAKAAQPSIRRRTDPRPLRTQLDPPRGELLDRHPEALGELGIALVGDCEDTSAGINNALLPGLVERPLAEAGRHLEGVQHERISKPHQRVTLVQLRQLDQGRMEMTSSAPAGAAGQPSQTINCTQRSRRPAASPPAG